MDRRDFIRMSAAGLVGIGLAPEIEAVSRIRGAKRSKNGYSIVILGDTHYDTAPDSVYHEGYSDPNPTRDANHRKEFVRNAEMWADKSPRLVKRAACLVDEGARMVFQTGDIIQGDTCGVDMHCRMLDDAFSYLKKEFGPLPLVTVVGNHDIRGNSDAEAREAYLKYMPAKMSGELGQAVDGVNFSFRIEDDVYIVVDFNKPDDEKVASLLKAADGARHTFVLIHGPVFPYDSQKYYKWYYHGKDKSPEVRDRMRKMLAEREVIVLCGHTHTTEFMDWYGDGGRITQMTMNSVWRNDETGRYIVDAEGAEEYGKLCGKDAFDEFRSGIRAYSHSVAAGSYKLNVNGESVTVDFYAGDSTRPSQRFVLR